MVRPTNDLCSGQNSCLVFKWFRSNIISTRLGKGLSINDVRLEGSKIEENLMTHVSKKKVKRRIVRRVIKVIKNNDVVYGCTPVE